MRSVRSTLLAGIALTAGYAAYPALAQQSPTIVLAQADDVAARLAAAEAAVAAAQAALEEAQANGGDVEAAQAQLQAAQAELAAAQQAAAAATEQAPESEPQATEAEPEQSPAEPEQAEQTPPVPEEAPDQDMSGQAEAPAEEASPPEEPAEELAQPDEPAAADEMQAEEKTEPTVEPLVEPSEQAEEMQDAQPRKRKADRKPAAEESQAESAEMTAEPDQTDDESVVEEQLKAQGDDEDARSFRDLRKKFREEQQAVEEQQSTEDEQQQATGDRGSDDADRQARRDGDGDRPRRDAPPDTDVVEDFGTRFILQLGGSLLIQQDQQTAGERFLYGAQDVDVENLRGGRTRTTITRADGVQIVTVRDRYGAIILRTRVDRRGREIVLIDNRDFYDRDDGRRPRYRFDNDLPPLRVGIPQNEYIVDTRRADRQQIRQALIAPPVEQVERPYALQEVLASDRLRDKVRRIDLSTINFEFGSAAIAPSEFRDLADVGHAMEDVLEERPDELFLVEGHTDAVGSDYANLLLSDKRAEAVAVALSTNFDIPPENLITQGYGEQFLKVPTNEAERENRRVAVLRITDLVRSASN